MSAGRNLLTPDVPEWLRAAGKNALLSARDVANIFGYARGGAARASNAGLLPKPDKIIKYGNYNQEYFFWRPSSIIKEIARRKALK